MLIHGDDQYSITASLVLYKTPPEQLQTVANCLSPEVHLVVVDNSPTPVLEQIVKTRAEATYHFAGINLGYGRGHNLALQLAPPSEFHLVINPDIEMEPTVLAKMLKFLEQNQEIALLAPRILNPDGSIQFLNRRALTVLDLLLRHLPGFMLMPWMQRRVEYHQMQDTGYSQTSEVECLSGAFMLLRRAVLEQVGGFDDRYFMYCEDFDLCKRLQSAAYKTVYYPEVSVTHKWERASSKQISMTFVHFRSMIIYFNTWGWRWL